MRYRQIRRSCLVLVVLVVLVGLIGVSAPTAAAYPSSPAAKAAVIPGPWEAVEDIVRNAVEDIQNAVTNLVNKFNWLLFTLPAPGHHSDPATWTDHPWDTKGLHFTDRWWNAVWKLYWGLSGVATVSLASLAVFHHSNRSSITGDPIHNQEKTQEAIRGFILVIIGWVALSLYLHGMNVLVDGVAPKDFTSTLGNFSKLGLGVIIGGIILSAESLVIVFAVLALIAQWILTIFAFATFPVAMVARVSGSNYAQVISDTIISLLIGLPLLKFVQVLLLRLVYTLPTPMGPSSLISIAVMTLGIGISFIYLPIKGTQRLLPEAMIATGGALRAKGTDSGSTDSKKAEAVSNNATKVASQVRTGPESASRRSTPSEPSTNRASEITDKSATGSQPVRADSGSKNARVAQPVSEQPSVTVNTSMTSHSQNTAHAEAEASATSRSERAATRTGRLPHQLLNNMKKRANQRRRKNKDTDD